MRDESFVTERTRLAEFLTVELGESHELPGLVLRGIAYHHARLPTSVQRAIELALERGWLMIVFATATLREGLHTPATTVILGGLSYRSQSGSTPISPLDFANIAGRAGRPRVETEGRVILVPDSLSMANAIEAGKTYVLSGESARRVRSQLASLKVSLYTSGGDLSAMPVADQRDLLGLVAAGLISAEELSVLVESTLWNVQEADVDEIDEFVAMASHAFEMAEQKFGPRLNLASRTSLSLSSSEQLREAIMTDMAVFQRVAEGSDAVRIEKLLAASLQLPEVNSRFTKPEGGTSVHLDPLLAWIEGERFEDVLERGKSSGLFAPSAKYGASVKYCVDASDLISWSFGAAWAIIEEELPDRDPAIGLLPLMVKFGVPTPPAAYLSLIGISDRFAAQVLATAFNSSGRPTTLEDISTWLRDVNFDDVFPRETHHLRAELLRRQVFGSSDQSPRYRMAEFIASRFVPADTDLSIRLIDRKLVLLHDGTNIGTVVEASYPDVRQLWRPRSLLYAITVSSADAGRPGRLIVFEQSSTGRAG